MNMSVPAFVICFFLALGLGILLTWFFKYKKNYKEPKYAPQRITDTTDAPVDILPEQNQDETAINRLNKEIENFKENDNLKKDFIDKMLELFNSYLISKYDNILALCYWNFKNDGFTLEVPISTYTLNENLFIPKDDTLFSEKEFIFNEKDEVPLEVFRSKEDITASFAGRLVSGKGKFYGYITISSGKANAFDTETIKELREFAKLTEGVLSFLDLNLKLNLESNVFYELLNKIPSLLNFNSKENVINNLSTFLKDNFRCDRLMLITPESSDRNKWFITEALGEQSELLKGISFEAKEEFLLYELLIGNISIINKGNITKDPYQYRLYSDEPDNLEFNSLLAITVPKENYSYPLVMVLESKQEKEFPKIDVSALSYILTCASLKLSNIENDDCFKQKKNDNLQYIDSDGLGEFFNYYNSKLENLRNSNENLCVIFLKFFPKTKENKAIDFEHIMSVLKKYKGELNGQHLALLGSGEFVLSVIGDFKEDDLKEIIAKFVENIRKSLAAINASVNYHTILFNKNKIEEEEKKNKSNIVTLFIFSVINKFKKMSEEAISNV